MSKLNTGEGNRYLSRNIAQCRQLRHTHSNFPFEQRIELAAGPRNINRATVIANNPVHRNYINVSLQQNDGIRSQVNLAFISICSKTGSKILSKQNNNLTEDGLVA